jgi:hypothetical protein
MSKATFVLATSLCLGGLLGCESAVLVNNDPGTTGSPDASMNTEAGTASYSESNPSADARGGATTQPAMSAETKDVSVQKQRDNP